MNFEIIFIHRRGKRDSSISILTRLWAGRPGFDSWQGNDGIFLFNTASRRVLGRIQSPIQLVSGTLTQGLKRLEREADNLPPSRTDVNNASSYTSIPQPSSWCGT
jgi:hypothetical protein